MTQREPSWKVPFTAYRSAAEWFARSVPAAQGRWDEPGLGVWTIRDLVGHAGRALITVETYLDHPALVEDITSPADYYLRVLGAAGSPTSVAQRGRDAGAALGDDPVSAVNTIVERVLAKAEGAEPTALLTTLGGGMRLVNYLPTRTFELVVHTCDLHAALSLPVAVPEAAARESAALLAELAVVRGRASELLLAATGRGPLPAGFTVL